VGSDRNAAFRSGVKINVSRLLAYAVGGFFAAAGGLALTMTTGIGSPLSGTYYTLSGVSAIVLGGVSLAGGRGGMLGPIAAAYILALIPADLIYLGIDPNYGQMIQGVLIVLVVMAGGLGMLLRRR
jgi:ribose transport system permease protein